MRDVHCTVYLCEGLSMYLLGGLLAALKGTGTRNTEHRLPKQSAELDTHSRC